MYLIRLGNTVINLDNVIRINLDYGDAGDVVLEFNVVGYSRDGEGAASEDTGARDYQPFTTFIVGEEAKSLRAWIRENSKEF